MIIPQVKELLTGVINGDEAQRELFSELVKRTTMGLAKKWANILKGRYNVTDLLHEAQIVFLKNGCECLKDYLLDKHKNYKIEIFIFLKAKSRFLDIARVVFGKPEGPLPEIRQENGTLVPVEIKDDSLQPDLLLEKTQETYEQLNRLLLPLNEREKTLFFFVVTAREHGLVTRTTENGLDKIDFEYLGRLTNIPSPRVAYHRAIGKMFAIWLRLQLEKRYPSFQYRIFAEAILMRYESAEKLKYENIAGILEKRYNLKLHPKKLKDKGRELLEDFEQHLLKLSEFIAVSSFGSKIFGKLPR